MQHGFLDLGIFGVRINIGQRLIRPATLDAEVVNGPGLQIRMILTDGNLAEKILSLGRAALGENEERAIFQLE